MVLLIHHKRGSIKILEVVKMDKTVCEITNTAKGKSYKILREGVLEGEGVVYRSHGSLDEQIAAFQAVGISSPYLATVEDVARIWDAGISDYMFSRLSTATIGFEGENPILYKLSPLTNYGMAKYIESNGASGIHLDSKFYTTICEVAKTEQKLSPELRTAQVLRGFEYKLAPDMDESRFLFGNFAEEYLGKHKVEIVSPPDRSLPKGKSVIQVMFFAEWNTIGFGLESWPGMEEWYGDAFGIKREN